MPQFGKAGHEEAFESASCIFYIPNTMQRYVIVKSSVVTSNNTTDDPPQGDSATDLLGALTSFHSSSSSSPSRSSSRSVNLDQNPLNNVSAPRRPGESTLRVENLMRQSAARKAQQQQKAGTTTVQDLKNHNLKKDLTKQITRRWRAGDVYAPHDLSGVEMMKWKRRSQPDHDVFDIINFNPEEHYRVCVYLDGLFDVKLATVANWAA